jgi:hypothetical protein
VDDRTALARLRVARGELQDVLFAIRAVQQDLGAALRPADPIHVMTNHIVVERPPVSHVDPRRLLAGDIVDKQIDHWIRLARLGICLDIEGVVDLGLVHLQVVIRYLLFVEAVIRELPAVRRPPHRGALFQFLPVDPAGGSVLGAFRLTAIGRDGYLAGAIQVAQPHIPIAIDGLQFPVGRLCGLELPSARRQSLADTTAKAALSLLLELSASSPSDGDGSFRRIADDG